VALNLTRRHRLASPHGANSVDDLTIGELADFAGVTVRTIRHYEAMGLLKPAERSLGGHRRYEQDDLARLRRIVTLRQCGFGLESIRRLLDAFSRDDALALTRRQLERSELELEVARRLRSRLRRFMSVLESSDQESVDELIAEWRLKR
jgi:DNA-binding transcriptional MerR regulator